MWTQWAYIASFRSHWKNLDQTAHEHRETSVKTSMINQWTTKYKIHESQRLNESEFTLNLAPNQPNFPRKKIMHKSTTIEKTFRHVS